MRKMNNKGITLIEILVSLAILSVFMIAVNFFLTSSSKSTKVMKKQVAVEQNAKEVYDRVYDIVVQATSIDLYTHKEISPATTTDKSITSRRSAAFNPNNEGIDTGAHFISKAAYDSIVFATEKFSSVQDYKNKYHVDGVGIPSTYVKDSLGKKTPVSDTVSQAEYDAAVTALSGNYTNYGVFDDGEYQVASLCTGPIKIDGTTTEYATLVYDAPSECVYLNRNTTGQDRTVNKNNLIARNCTAFTVKTECGKNNSLNLKMNFSDGGYSYTVGGTINIRNAKVMK